MVPRISAVRRVGWEDREFVASFGYTVEFCLKKIINTAILV